MHPRRRTIHQFNAVQEYFKKLDANTKFKTRMTQTYHPRCSVSHRNTEHPSSVQNIKVLAQKIKLVLEDGAQIKFSSYDTKTKQKDLIASSPQIEHKDESKLRDDNTQAATQEFRSEKVRVYINQKIGAGDHWLKYFDNEDEQVEDQLDNELSLASQNQNTDFFNQQDPQNFFDQKQTLWESQADVFSFWSFENQDQSQKQSVSDLVDAQTQNILEALQKQIQISNEDS